MSERKKAGNYYRKKNAQKRKNEEKQGNFMKQRFVISNANPVATSSSSVEKGNDKSDDTNKRTKEVSFF